jgi:hypothetical protein
MLCLLLALSAQANAAYVMLNVDPEAAPLTSLPIGFDVIITERDIDDEGTGEAIWVVTHATDATLTAEILGRGIAWLEHGEGAWDGSGLVRRVQGTDMVEARQLFDQLRGTLAIGQKAVLDEALTHLPADPRG